VGLLAHGMEPMVPHELFQGEVIGPARRRNLEPRRLAIWQLRGMSGTLALQMDEGRAGHN